MNPSKKTPYTVYSMLLYGQQRDRLHVIPFSNRYGSCYQNRETTPAQNYSNPVTHTLRYIMRRIQGRVPRLLLFGSGLESIPLIRLMILEKNSPYQPIGLFPGKDGNS